MAEIAGAIWRNGVSILVCVVVLTMLAAGVYSAQRPIYSSTARVLVQTDQLGAPSFLSGIAAYRESQIQEPVNRKIETEMALILNRSSAQEIVQSLGIRSSQIPAPPIAVIKESFRSRVRGWLGLDEIKAKPGSNSKLVDDFLASFSVEPMRSKTAETTSNVLEVRFDTTDPELAPRALQAMLASYARVSTQQNRRLGAATADLLNTQISRARDELLDVENAMVALTVRESQRSEVIAASSLSAPAQSIGGAPRREGARTAAESAAIQMVQQLVDMQAQLDDLRQTYTDETESVRKLKARVAELRGRIAAQVRLSATANAENTRLDRQRVLAQDHYIELRRKLEQISLYMDLTPTALDGRVVVDPPSRPEPGTGENKKLVLVLGPVAGLLLGLLLASMREFMLPRIRTPRDLRRYLAIPLIGTHPPSRGSGVPSTTFEAGRTQ